MRLTDQFVAAVQATTTNAVYRDDEQPGFCLRVTSAGAKSWYLEARIRGQLYNRKIAPASIYKTREARAIARQWIGELTAGVDSKAALKESEQQAKKDAVKRKNAETIGSAAEAYIKAVELKPATVLYYQKLAGNGLKAYAGKILKEVDAEFIKEIFAEISDRTSPKHATKCVRYIRTLCIWRDMPSPIPPRLRLASSKPRQARLEPQDGVSLWSSLKTRIKSESEAYVAVMLFTGCRTNELSTLKVGQVDLVAGNFKLENTKNGRDHRVYMCEQVEKIMGRFMKNKGPDELVFPHARTGRNVRERKNEQHNWSNHDLRKLFAIVAMEIGIPYPVIKAAMNHSTTDVTLAHYAQATPSQLRNCWARVADFYEGKTCTNSTLIKEPQSALPNELTNGSTSSMSLLGYQERQGNSQTA